MKPWWHFSDFKSFIRNELQIDEQILAESKLLIVFYLASRVRKQLTCKLTTLDFQGKTESEIGSQIKKFIKQDAKDGYIDTFCLDLPRFYQALIRIGSILCEKYELSQINEQFSYFIDHFLIKNTKIGLNSIVYQIFKKLRLERHSPFKFDQDHIFQIYNDFRVNLFQNQIDQRSTNGKIDVTGVINYLTKARVYDAHKVNRGKALIDTQEDEDEKDELINCFNFYSILQLLKGTKSAQEALKYFVERYKLTPSTDSNLQKTDIFQLMLFVSQSKEGLIRRSSKRKEELDFAIDISEFKSLLELISIKITLTHQDFFINSQHNALEKISLFLMIKSM